MGEIQPDESLDGTERDALRKAAARERSGGSAELASLMEHFAEHGLPSVEECTPWERIRDERYQQLGILADGPRVA